MANQPQLMVELGSLFYGGLDDDARELLNLPHPSSKPSLMKIENRSRNVGNAFRRFLKTYDPYPTFKEPTAPDEIGAHQLTGTGRRASRSTRRSGTSVTSTASSSAWSASTASQRASSR